MANKSTYELEVKLGASTSASWTAALGEAEKGLEGLNSVADKVAAGIAAGVTATAATATLAISNAVDTYKGFEQEMATVKSISGATEAEYTAMKEAALDAGRGTIYTAEESASALEYMSLAGWSVQDSIEGLTPMLQMAAATGAELQTTSDLVTDSMSALGLGVDGLEDYMDKLIITNNNANTTSEQLMEALVKTGGASRVLGASLDDTITSLGIMANNGTKAEEAGTALNAIMVRLAGNTQAIGELDNLGVNIWDDNGEFIGWKESLQLIDGALSDLTDEQRALSLKKIAGTNHYSQFEYLLEGVRGAADGTESAWDLLEEQVENSNGALQKMYDTTTDTLENAQAKLNSAKEDMQIRLVDVFSDDAKDFINWLATSLPKVTDALAEFAAEHQKDFADMLDGMEDGIETLWENGITAGNWIIKNKGTIAGALKAVAAQIVAVKAATAGLKIAQLLTNPVTAAGVAASAACVGIGLFKGHLDDLAEAAKDADLEGRFGDISLSMLDIEAAAANIVSSKSLTGVLEALEQFSELDEYQQQIDEAVETLNKYNWKVSIGLTLTEDENDAYKSEIESYVKAAQEYALQAQYAVQLSMEVTFDDADLEESNIVSKVNNFYSDKYGELTELGTKLNEAVTNAFNDGLLDIDEVKEISEIQRQMADIQSQLAVGELDARLALMEQDYSGIKLTPESYEALEEELSDQVDSAMESYDEAFVKNYQAITNAYQNGEGEEAMTREEYDSAINALKEEYANQKAELSMKALQFELNTIDNGYGDEIEQYTQLVADTLEKYNGDEGEWKDSPFKTWDAVIQEIRDNGIDDASKDAINELLDKMEPAIQSLYDIVENDWYSLDSETQDTVTGAIRNIELLQAMASKDDTQALYRDVANQAVESAGEGAAKTYAEDNYEELTGYSVEGYGNFNDYVEKRASGSDFNVTSNSGVSKNLQYDTGGTSIDSETVNEAYENITNGSYRTPAKQGFSNTYDTSLADVAPGYTKEAAAPEERFKDESESEVTYTWKDYSGTIASKTGKNAVAFDTDSVKEATDKAYEELGQYAKDTAEPEIEGMYAWSQEQIDEYFSQGFTANSDLDIVLNPYFKLLGSNPLSLFTGGKLYSNAEGGIYDSPILTTFAEEGPEAAIPLDGTPRAAALWTEAGERLGLLKSVGGDSTAGITTMSTDESRDEKILNSLGGNTINTQSIRVSFAPNVMVQGSATKEDVQGALSLTLDQLRDMISDIQRENQRVSFG